MAEYCMDGVADQSEDCKKPACRQTPEQRNNMTESVWGVTALA